MKTSAEMLATRQALGWMVDPMDLKHVPLAELFALREKYPFMAEDAPTNIESAIAGLLDTGIDFALISLGLCWQKDDNGQMWFGFVGPKDSRSEIRRASYAEIACITVEYITTVRDEWDANAVAAAQQELDVLSQAMSGDAEKLYAGTFAPPADDEVDTEELEPWWQILGYGSLQEWLARPPWWQVEGYESEDEAEAAFEPDADDKDNAWEDNA